MGFNIETIFDLCDKSYEERKQRKDKFLAIVNKKIDKMTDDQINKLTEWFEMLE